MVNLVVVGSRTVILEVVRPALVKLIVVVRLRVVRTRSQRICRRYGGGRCQIRRCERRLSEVIGTRVIGERAIWVGTVGAGVVVETTASAKEIQENVVSTRRRR